MPDSETAKRDRLKFMDIGIKSRPTSWTPPMLILVTAFARIALKFCIRRYYQRLIEYLAYN